MIYKYGENLVESQFEEFKDKLHKEIHWLLIYKDPRETEKYSHVNFNKYFEGLMRRLDGMNSLMFYPKNMIFLLDNLEAAYLETIKDDFNYSAYRKLIFDAQASVDKIGG